MPRQRRLTLGEILDNVPLRALAYGGRYTQPYKRRGSNTMYLREQRWYGCRIPTWILQKFATPKSHGGWTPKPATVKKIVAAYRRWASASLRVAGMSSADAKAKNRKPPDVIQMITEERLQKAREIIRFREEEGRAAVARESHITTDAVAPWGSEERHATFLAVTWGMSMSSLILPEYDVYGGDDVDEPDIDDPMYEWL